MKKFGTWLLNHLGLVLGIVTFTVTLGVIGGVMLKSHNDYLEYEKEFYRTDLEIRSISAAQPNYIEIDDSFVSSNANKQVLTADKLTVTTTQESYLKDGVIDITEKGGTIAAKMKLEKMSFVDIDFEVATEYVKEAASEEEEDEYYDEMCEAAYARMFNERSFVYEDCNEYSQPAFCDALAD